MSYGVELGPEAEADVAKLPPLVASFVLDALERLATDPVNLGRPPHFPYRPTGRAFRCGPFEHEGVRYSFYVAFRYTQDEQRIHIDFIAVTTIP